MYIHLHLHVHIDLFSAWQKLDRCLVDWQFFCYPQVNNNFGHCCILTGWAAVALTRLNKTAEAAKLAAGPDGQTPCGYQTLRYLDITSTWRSRCWWLKIWVICKENDLKNGYWCIAGGCVL